jgi:hypothetical protein
MLSADTSSTAGAFLAGMVEREQARVTDVWTVEFA